MKAPITRKGYEALQTELDALTPPSTQLALSQAAGDYMATVVRWLTLELNYLETLTDSLLEEANNTIPEITAREFQLGREISTVRFVYNLD